MAQSVVVHHQATTTGRSAELTLVPFPAPQHARTLPWEKERSLMRGLHELFEGAGDPDAMKRFGGLWRMRIRKDPRAVEIALERVSACRHEAQWSLGGMLNKEWLSISKARQTQARA